MKKCFFFSCFFLLGFTLITSAQLGESSAAMSMSKQKSALGLLPSPEEIIVDEYINYHTHEIAMPSNGNNVGLDIRWQWENKGSSQREGILQIGIATHRGHDRSEMPPVNISLVIDRSGSMSSDQKMEKTKQALLTFVRQLRPQDVISIVSFDDVAEVAVPAQSVGNRQTLERAIQQLYPRGSTNLHDGILVGYREILKNYKPKQTNRLLLLTDAMTNQGILDPAKMIANAKEYNPENQVDFAMIGVGIDFNHQLSRQLTSSQRNLIHFINDPQDIEKVFVKEVESLLAPVAKNPVLEIEFDASLNLEQVFGYQPIITNNRIRINLNNINAGLTKVVLAKFSSPRKWFQTGQIKAWLHYYDIAKGKDVAQEVALEGLKNSSKTFEQTKDIQKNYLIAQMGQSLKSMATFHAQNRHSEAAWALDQVVQKVRLEYPIQRDQDIDRMVDILENYRGVLSESGLFADEWVGW